MKTIAVVGKGGVGKTAISALLINYLAGKGTVLAIDADPSTNLNLALGTPLKGTVGSARENFSIDITRGRISPSVSKQEILDMKIRESLVEGNRIDLLPMGRPEGPGCYCAANNMLRQSIDRIAKDYDYVVMDCEAGMEHISRQTTRDIDILLVVSDPTLRGIVTAAGMKSLMGELRTRVGHVYLVLNRVKGEISDEIKRLITENKMELLISIPEDPGVGTLDARGTPLSELDPSSPMRQSVLELAKKIGL